VISRAGEKAFVKARGPRRECGGLKLRRLKGLGGFLLQQGSGQPTLLECRVGGRGAGGEEGFSKPEIGIERG